MLRQKISLIIGALFAVAAVLMVRAYLTQQQQVVVKEANRRIEVARKKLEESQENQTAVLVAKSDIPRGSTVDKDTLEVKIIPNQFVQPQAVTSLDRIAGMMTIAPIYKGEQITLAKLMYPRQAAAGGLAEVTPVGKRAVSIVVDNIASLFGMVKAGNYIDVIAMMSVPVQTADGKQMMQVVSVPLFQNVLVLAVGQQLSSLSVPQQPAESRYQKPAAEASQADVSSMITLSLSPQEANILSFVQEQGSKLRLVMRSPTDAKIEAVPPASWDTLFQYIIPRQMAEAPAPSEGEVMAKPTPTVEIYRGLAREEVPLKE